MQLVTAAASDLYLAKCADREASWVKSMAPLTKDERWMAAKVVDDRLLSERD